MHLCTATLEEITSNSQQPPAANNQSLEPNTPLVPLVLSPKGDRKIEAPPLPSEMRSGNAQQTQSQTQSQPQQPPLSPSLTGSLTSIQSSPPPAYPPPPPPYVLPPPVTSLQEYGVSEEEVETNDFFSQLVGAAKKIILETRNLKVIQLVWKPNIRVIEISFRNWELVEHQKMTCCKAPKVLHSAHLVFTLFCRFGHRKMQIQSDLMSTFVWCRVIGFGAESLCGK